MLYRHSFSTLLQNIPLGRSSKIQVGLKLNGIYKLLAYAEDVILLEDHIDAIKKIT
jgi:hypothetical protein